MRFSGGFWRVSGGCLTSDARPRHGSAVSAVFLACMMQCKLLKGFFGVGGGEETIISSCLGVRKRRPPSGTKPVFGRSPPVFSLVMIRHRVEAFRFPPPQDFRGQFSRRVVRPVALHMPCSVPQERSNSIFKLDASG